MFIQMTETIRIPNISDYTQEVIDGTLILKPKKIIITEEELKMTSLTKSKIIECCVTGENNEVVTNAKQYRSILTNIWTMTPAQKILQNTIFNFKLTNEYGEKGYNWNDRIKMSFQSKDSNGTMKEIIKMCKINNYRLDISIKLENNKLIHFKIE